MQTRNQWRNESSSNGTNVKRGRTLQEAAEIAKQMGWKSRKERPAKALESWKKSLTIEPNDDVKKKLHLFDAGAT